MAVSAATKFGDANVIITADDVPTLHAYLAERGITDISEVRQTATYLGPVVQLASIDHVLAESAGITAAKDWAYVHGDRTAGREVTDEEAADAKERGLVIVFGYSDDGTEFRGAIRDEVGSGELSILQSGKILDRSELEALESLVADGTVKAPVIRKINSNYGDDGVWRFATDIPHSTFDVTEDGILYCVAIVFSILDL